MTCQAYATTGRHNWRASLGTMVCASCKESRPLTSTETALFQETMILRDAVEHLTAGLKAAGATECPLCRQWIGPRAAVIYTRSTRNHARCVAERIETDPGYEVSPAAYRAAVMYMSPGFAESHFHNLPPDFRAALRGMDR